MADRKHAIAEQRLTKLSRIRSYDIDPYPHRYRRTHTTEEAVALFRAQEGSDGESLEVSVAGRIMSLRSMGKATFLDLRDSSGKIQAYFKKNTLGDEKYRHIDDFDIGDIIGVRGRVFKTRSAEITIEVSDFTMLAKSLMTLPEKWHGLTDVEKRYRQRYLDLISNEEARSIFATRSRLITAMRRFLDERGFIEVETPVLLPVAAGAMARPFSTFHHTLEMDLYLRIALELYLKRLIIGGMDKVYEIGRIFRNEGISIKHNPEFTMLESYEAYADYNDVMDMLEQMVSRIAQEITGSLQVPYGEHIIDFTPPWRRVNYRDALKEKSGIDVLDDRYRDVSSLKSEVSRLALPEEDNVSWGRTVDKLFSIFVEPSLIQPTFVLDHPIEMSPLAKAKPDEPRLVERFECFIGGMEVANAFTELNDPLEQRKRFEEQERLRSLMGDEEVERLDEDFLVALEHGMPPTGGLGMGIDRLVMLLTNQQSIREVILFPQLKQVAAHPYKIM
ncbi:MAG: lysine--tRNA ligase [Chloroflexota bacterium]|nr:lysine--tRNA ligase [Chloroflexota bacterium]